jgi:hypothetical protein
MDAIDKNATREASDWFSPILVKELRQGTRSRAFVWSFLALHTVLLLLVVTTLISAASPHTDYDHAFVTGFFWSLIGIPLLLVLPSVAFGSIKKEIDARTLELIFLTRMTTLRIVFGKWAALTVQGMLIVTAILPYMILRYFLGGIDLVDELTILFCLVLGSLTLTAAGIGFSSVTSRFFRVGLIIFVLLFLTQGLYGIAFFMFGPGGGFLTAATGPGFWLWLPVAAGVLIFLMLEFGAGRIAPPAENHALRKRTAGLVLLAGGLIFHYWYHPAWVALILVAIPLVLVCGEAVNESLRPYAILRRSRLARGKGFPVWLRIFFAPGWPSGVAFTLLTAGIYLSVLANDGNVTEEAILVVLCICASLFFPVAIIRLVSPATERGGVFFILIQALMICAGISALVIAEATYFNVAAIYQFLPIPVIMLLIGDHLSGSITQVTYVMAFVNALSLLILLALGSSQIRRITADDRVVIEEPDSAPDESLGTAAS